MAFVYRMRLTKLAGTEALGLNALVMQVYSIVVSVCISGLSIAVTAAAARLSCSDDRGGGLYAKLLKKAVAVYCALFISAALPIFLFRRGVAANALGSPGAADVLAVMLVCIFMTGLENVSKAMHMGAGLAGRCAASELCEQGVRFALVIILLTKLSHPNIERTVLYIMLGMTASELVSVGFLSASVLASLSPRGAAVTQIAPPSYRELLKVAFPASATAMASTVFSSAAALLLPGRLVSFGMTEQQALSLIGVLSAVAVPIAFFPMAAVSAVASVLMPRVAARFSAGGDIKPLARSALKIAALIGPVSALFILPAAPYIARSLFSAEVSPALIAALLLKASVIYVQMVCTAVLNGAKRQGTVLLFAVTGEAYQLILMLLLTPIWGIFGYAAAMIAGETLRLLCCLAALKEL